MKFELKNIGIVENANIELNGITVLSGLNDSGKSTLSKALFCAISSINTGFEDWEYNILSKLRKYIDRLNQLINDDEEFRNISDMNFKKVLQTRIDLNDLFTKLVKTITKNESNSMYDINKNDSYPSYVEMKKYIKEKVDLLDSLPLATNTRKNISNILNEIECELDSPSIESIRKKIKSYFIESVVNEFRNDILTFEKNDGYIKLTVDSNEIYNFTLALDETRDKEKYNIEIDYIKNSKPNISTTYVESPTVMFYSFNLLNSFISVSYLGGQQPTFGKNAITKETPLHVRDFIQKVRSVKYFDRQAYLRSSYGSIKYLLNNISSIIGGSVFVFSDDNFTNERITFLKDNRKIELSNTACGVKAFLMLELLLQSDEFDRENNILLIDEPENHLHPLWQIKYVEVLILILEKLKIKTLLVTHSPYIIQAVNALSKKYKCTDKIKFYLSNMKTDSNSIEFSDVSENIDPLIDLLSSPLFEMLQY